MLLNIKVLPYCNTAKNAIIKQYNTMELYKLCSLLCYDGVNINILLHRMESNIL